jgi:hypothetical protein
MNSGMNTQVVSAAQRQNNRRVAIGLALFSFGVFASFIVRQWMANA